MEDKNSSLEEYYNIEKTMNHKWSKILENKQKYLNENSLKKKKVKLLTCIGIPDQLRGYIWQIFAGVDISKVRNQYYTLLLRATNPNSNYDDRIEKNENDIIKDFSFHIF